MRAKGGAILAECLSEETFFFVKSENHKQAKDE